MVANSSSKRAGAAQKNKKGDGGGRTPAAAKVPKKQSSGDGKQAAQGKSKPKAKPDPKPKPKPKPKAKPKTVSTKPKTVSTKPKTDPKPKPSSGSARIARKNTLGHRGGGNDEPLFDVVQVPGDGSCFYHSVLRAMGPTLASELFGCDISKDTNKSEADCLRNFLAKVTNDYPDIVNKQANHVKEFNDMIQATRDPGDESNDSVGELLSLGPLAEALLHSDPLLRSHAVKYCTLTQWATEFEIKILNRFLERFKITIIVSKPDTKYAVNRALEIESDDTKKHRIIFLNWKDMHYNYYKWKDVDQHDSMISLRKYLELYISILF